MAEHTIEAFSIRLKSRNPKQAKQLKDSLLRLLKGALGASLEQVLDLYDRPGATLLIDTLQLNLGRLEKGNWKKRLTRELVQAIAKALAQQTKRREGLNSDALALRYFLEKGALPYWWEGDFEAFLDSLPTDSLRQAWSYLEKADGATLRRWIWQLPEKQRWAFIAQKLTATQLKQAKQTQQTLSPNAPNLMLFFWQTALEFAKQKEVLSWQAFWQNQLDKQGSFLQKAFSVALNPKAVAVLVAADYQSRYTAQDVLRYYLEQGALPIWSKRSTESLLKDYLEHSWTQDETSWREWLQAQGSSRNVLLRLTRLLPEKQLWNIVERSHSKAAFRFAQKLLKAIDAILPELSLSVSSSKIQVLLRFELLHYAVLRIGKPFFKRKVFERLLASLSTHSKTKTSVLLETLKKQWSRTGSKEKEGLTWLQRYETPQIAAKESEPARRANLEQPTGRAKLDYLYFILNYGTEPWWAADWPDKELASILTELLAERPKAFMQAIRTWSQQEKLWQRLVEQFPEAQLTEILLQQLPDKGGAWLRLAALLEDLPVVLTEFSSWSKRRLKWAVILKEALRSSEDQTLEQQLQTLFLALAEALQITPLRLLEALEQLLLGEEQAAFRVLGQIFSTLKQQTALRNWKADPTAAWKRVFQQLKTWGYSATALQARLVEGRDMPALKRYLQEGLLTEQNEAIFLQKLRALLQEKNEEALQAQSVKLEQERLERDLLLTPEVGADFELQLLENRKKRPKAVRQFLRSKASNPVLRQGLEDAEEATIKAIAELWELPNVPEWLALLADAKMLDWGTAARQQFWSILLQDGDLKPLDWLQRSLRAEAAAQSREILPLLLDWRSTWRRKGGYSPMPFYLLQLQVQQLDEAIAQQENPRMRSILRERLAASRQELKQLEQEQVALKAVWRTGRSTAAIPEELAARLEEIGRLEREKVEALAEQAEKDKERPKKTDNAAEKAAQELYLQALYASLSPKLRLALAKQRQLEAAAAELTLSDITPITEPLALLPNLPAAQLDSWTKTAFTQSRLKAFFKALAAWEQLLKRKLSAYLREEQDLTDIAEQLPYLQRSLEQLCSFLKDQPQDFEQEGLQLRTYLKAWSEQLEILSSQFTLLMSFEPSLKLRALGQLVEELEQLFERVQVQRQSEGPLAEADAFGLEQLEKWLTQQDALRAQLEQLRDWPSLERWEKERKAVERRQKAEGTLTVDIERRWEALDDLFEKQKAKLKVMLEEKRAEKQAALEAAAQVWAERSSQWLQEALRSDKRVEKSKLREALEKRSKQEKTAGIPLLVKNAGLVLLWPFFSRFFKMLKLLEGKKFVDEAAQLKAIHLLQYLATTQTETPEYELALNKVLCGWPLAEPIPRSVDLSEEELAVADSLLGGVLQNWSKMKSTTPDGLRGGFIIRNGQLTETDERWELVVERGTLDILLKTLPWGYNLIALPWMPKMIGVEW